MTTPEKSTSVASGFSSASTTKLKDGLEIESQTPRLPPKRKGKYYEENIALQDNQKIGFEKQEEEVKTKSDKKSKKRDGSKEDEASQKKRSRCVII